MNNESAGAVGLSARGGSGTLRAERRQRSSDEDLVIQYLPVIRKIAGLLMRRLPQHIRLDDLEAAGIVGLLGAAQMRDPQRADQFDQYARCRIEGAMLDELRKQDMMPKDLRTTSNRILAAMRTVEQRDGKIEEEAVAAELQVSVEQYREMLERTVDVRLLSLEGSETGQKLQLRLPDEEPTALDAMVEAESCAQVAAALGRLPDKQRKVLALYYVEELNMKEIAMALNMSVPRVCQLHSEGVHAVRMMLMKEKEA